MTESPYPFTVGGMLAVTLACSILVSVFMAVIIMCCSANMKSSFGPAVTGILLAFLPLFTNVIPKSCRGLTMIAQALPGSFGEIHSVFADQLLQIGNLMLPAYIYVPVCYLILGTAMAVFMGRGYLKRE